MAGYGESDRERRVLEARKTSPRGDFARDRARVLHSSALRRLGGKTQVVGPGHDDFARTRLTHSLEVAQVGRELATTLGCDPDVVDTACLAHDLGHPPFGHNGETALAEVMAEHGGFEGNAQSLRLLTRLEPKVVAADGSSAGLNLTRAALDASIKYPWPRTAASAKFGVYDDDLPVFGWVRAGMEDGRRCLEAQVMDLSDDIAYSVHDVEDAVVGGRLDPAVLTRPEEIERIASQVRAWYRPEFSTADVSEALRRLQEQPWWLGGYDASRRSLAALKDLTSELIGRFARACALATLGRWGPGPLTRYAADVVVPHDTDVEINTLKGIAAVYVMIPEDRRDEYESQRALLTGLVRALCDSPHRLEPAYASDFAGATSESGRMRAVVDQVASLTDASARRWARALSTPD
jgi:dGTPase